ncbi:hypothetical protein GAMM_70015 [Gammaproteobacteria bacterium]
MAKIKNATMVERTEIEMSSWREYAGCFEAINNTLLIGLIRAKKYKEFSMICDRSIARILLDHIFLSIY